MVDLKFEQKSYAGFSYSKSIFLSSWKISKAQSSINLSDLHSQDDKSVIFGELFKENVDETFHVHTCMNWVSENKIFSAEPAPLAPLDCVKETKNINKKRNLKSIKSTLKKIINFLKINISKKNKHEKITKINTDENIEGHLISQFDTNTNRPCSPFSVSKIHSGSENRKHNTFSSLEESSEEIPLSSENSDFSNHDSEKLIYDKKIEKKEVILPKNYTPSEEVSFISPEVDEIPQLVISRSYRRKTSIDATKVHEGNSLYNFIDILAKSHPSKTLVPSNYKSRYTFFIYMYPYNTDGNLLLFQRHELKNISKFLDPFDLMNLIAETKADFLIDRRLKMVQNQSKCCIILEPLNCTYINGLPYRSLNIYSFNYENIAKALSIMEDVMPEIMRTSVFKYALPTTFPNKWSSNKIVVRPIKKAIRNDNRNQTWFNRIDPDLRFSSFNYVVTKEYPDNPAVISGNKIIRKSMKVNIEKSDNKPVTPDISELDIYTANNAYVAGFDTTSDLSDIVIGIHQKNTNESKLDKGLRNINTTNVLSGKSPECCRMKKIKCPASILNGNIFCDSLALDNLFRKFLCKIIKVENPDNKTGIKDGQVKLTILYSSKEQLQAFVDALGLCKRYQTSLDQTIFCDQ